MREIKFKAQRADGKGWVIGFYVFTSNKYHQILTGKWSNASGSHYAHEVDPNTVCQFTSLQDKNGVDIYEGDKVNSFKEEYGDNPAKNRVIMKKGCFKLCSNGKEDMPLFNYKSTELEVIGNIHDKTDKP